MAEQRIRVKPIPVYRSTRCHQQRCGLPRELLFADDLAVVTDTEEEMQKRWLVWPTGSESKDKSQHRENGSDGQ